MKISKVASELEPCFSLYELISTSELKEELPAHIYFDKAINLDIDKIYSSSSFSIKINTTKRFNHFGNCLLAKVSSIEPGKRLIRIENFLFVNAQLVLTRNDGSKYVLAKGKGFLELKGKVELST